MAHPAAAVLEYHLVIYRRVWRGSAFSSFLLPVLFFVGMGVMVGSYVDRGGTLDQPYLEFIAPALLAFTGLQIGMSDASYPVMGGFKWRKIYYGMVAAPPRVGDMVAGELGFIGFRALLSATAFLLVMVAFGAVSSVWAVVLPLIAVLLALAVAAPMCAFSATVDSVNLLAVMIRFGMLPMMLFGGVFFPVSQLPVALQPLAYATPLWHGVELCRAAAAGVGPAWPVAVHVGYLAVWLVVGWFLAQVRFAKRLGG